MRVFRHHTGASAVFSISQQAACQPGAGPVDNINYINHSSGAKKQILLELQGSAKYGGLASRPRNIIIFIGT